MSDGSRRTFIGLTLSAAGAQLMHPAASAVGATRDLPKSEQDAALHVAQADNGNKRPRTPTLDTVYLVVYRPGEKWLVGQPLEAQPLQGHGRYMLSLFREGTLRHAGRFEDGSGGAAVFTAADDAAATAVVEKDPVVASKVFAYELRRWVWVDWAKLGPAPTA